LQAARPGVNGIWSIVDNLQRRGSNACMKTLSVATLPRRRTASPTIALLQSSTLTSVVQGELERMILSGELAPGAKLTEMALADRLGVSRGPVREAFRMLEEAGLVRTEKNRGVFVRDIPLDEAMEIYDLRAAMDELVGRQLAVSHHAGAAEGAARLVDADGARWSRRAHARLSPAEPAVPRPAGRDSPAIASCSPIYRKLIKELSLFRRQPGRRPLMPVSAGEHRHIVKAIASGDPRPPAARSSPTHVLESKERTIAQPPRRPGPHPESPTC
jgi:DNA-binding GntR family transcriptional regulator